MTCGKPLWWCAALLATGIAAGLLAPSAWYLPASALTLVAGTLMHAMHKGGGLALLAFWLFMGAARASMDTLPPTPAPPAWESMQAEATRLGGLLHTRLHKAGLRGESLSVGSALLLGRRESISRSTTQAYRESGAAHLLALSGLHLGILYGLLHLVVIRRIRLARWRWIALAPLLLLVWGYVLLAGIPPSLVRAAAMCSVTMVASLARRNASATHTLTLSALAILLWSPSSLLSVSLQLSFMAVFFILAACARPHTGQGWPGRMRQMAAVSSAAWLGTSPLSAYYFHNIPLLSVPLSMLLVPLTTLIVYLTAATLILPVAPLAACLDMLISLQNSIVRLGASLPHTIVRNLYPDWWHVAATYALLLLAITRLNARRRQALPTER
ncbi:MAG TPA: hypothetical protein DC006_00450 [Prevotellaceae bacterium]|nr:hypothetical protein [Prevotellaceae bacterium]